MVFRDKNGNGRQDPGETPLSGVIVYLDANNDGKLDNGEATFRTGADGRYSFSVKAGAYHVRRVNAKVGYFIAVGAGQRVSAPVFADRS